MGVPVAADQSYKGEDVTITGTVNGNVTMKNGTLTITGTVEGAVTQKKGGSVIVAGGVVTGRVKERGAGDVRVLDGGVVYGDVIEKGEGELEVNGSAVMGNVRRTAPATSASSTATSLARSRSAAPVRTPASHRRRSTRSIGTRTTPTYR
jgi:hypothetical protein